MALNLLCSQLYVLRGPSNSIQHRKHWDSPCSPGGCHVPYVISFFSLASLNNLSLWSQNKCIESTRQILQPTGKPLLVSTESRKTMRLHNSVVPGSHGVHAHAHGNPRTYMSTPAFKRHKERESEENTHTHTHTHTHAHTHTERKRKTHTKSICLLFRTAVVLRMSWHCQCWQ